MPKKTASQLVSLSVVVCIIALDQWLKIWVKTSMLLGERIQLVGDWANLLFVENKGMAFGWDGIPTFVLSLLRIAACIVIALYMRVRIRQGMSLCGTIVLSLILAGAMGNIIDNALYGLVFTQSSTWQVAELVPIGQGYGAAFAGRVVDMFYFPIINTTLPDALGGGEFIFFSPIFNLADAAITVGVILAIIFHKHISPLTEGDAPKESE